MADGEPIPDPLQIAAESSRRLEAAGAFAPLRILQRAVLECGIDTEYEYGESRTEFAFCIFCSEFAQIVGDETGEQAATRIEHGPHCAYRVAMELPPLSVPVVPRHLRHIEFEASE